MNEVRLRSGFAFVDLLLVVAVIAVAAVIAIPVFAYIGKTSSKGQCASNMGKLASAMSVYAADCGGRLPEWYDGSNTWDIYLVRYVKNPRFFVCPANTADCNSRPYAKGATIRSYALPKNISGVEIAVAPKPSLTVMLYEKGECPLGQPSDACGEYFDQIGGGRSPNVFWHGSGKNFAFFDGHVKYWNAPCGPFSYNYPSFAAWSTAEFTKNPGGPGYCGWADNLRPGGIQGSPNAFLPGGNIPQ